MFISQKRASTNATHQPSLTKQRLSSGPEGDQAPGKDASFKPYKSKPSFLRNSHHSTDQDALGRPTGGEGAVSGEGPPCTHLWPWRLQTCGAPAPSTPFPFLPPHCSLPVSPECEGSWGSSQGGLPAGVAGGESAATPVPGEGGGGRELGSQPRELRWTAGRSRQPQPGGDPGKEVGCLPFPGPRTPGGREASAPTAGRGQQLEWDPGWAELCRLSPGCQLRAPPPQCEHVAVRGGMWDHVCERGCVPAECEEEEPQGGAGGGPRGQGVWGGWGGGSLPLAPGSQGREPRPRGCATPGRWAR